MPLVPGSTFAGYTVVRELGTGGMGAVYLVRHPRLPRVEALKVLRPEYTADADFARRFLHESEVVAGLEHRNIVPVLDRGEDEGRLWLTMRYVDGIDAEQALAAAGGLLPAERTVRIVGEVAAALDSAHRAHLVHRDVKPANVLLTIASDDEPEQVFLTDFGIAKALEADTRLTRTGMVLATFDYASPEQIESQPLDGRSDVYSLGCLLYRMLTGAKPYPGDSVAAALHGHLVRPVPRPTATAPWLPPGLDDVVARAMAKTPEERYQTCRALAADARAALDSYPPPPTPLEWLSVTGAGAPSGRLSGDRLPAPDSDRLVRLLRRTRFFDLPADLPRGDDDRSGRWSDPADRVVLEATAGGRTHRVAVDLGTARRPPELTELVAAVREMDHESPPVAATTITPAPVAAAPAPAVPAPAAPRSAAPSASSAPTTTVGTAPTEIGALGQPAGRPATRPGSPGPSQQPPGPAFRPPTPAFQPRPATPPRRGRGGLLAAAVVVLLVLAGGGVWLLTRGDDAGDDGGSDPGAASSDTGATGGPTTSGALADLPAAGALPDTAVVVSLATDDGADLYVVDSTAGDVGAQLTSATGEEISPVVLPGRETVVYSGGDGGELRAVASDGTGDRALFPDGTGDCADPGRPTFDPTDPTRLAVICGGNSLRLLTVDGQTVATLHENEPVLGDPTFSPDGSKVAFYAGNDPDRDGGALMYVDVDTPGQASAVTEGGDGEDADPAWSPDGTRIAYRREIVADQRGIVLADPFTVDSGTYVTSGNVDQDPVWSPDGTTVAYKSNASGTDALWVLDAEDYYEQTEVPGLGQIVGGIAWN